MKKSFLIAGLIAGITATNSYADIVISQSDEIPDIIVSARAGKINNKPTNVLARAQNKVADGGAVAINCPVGCTPDCAILGNVVLCECKASDGSTCKADVVTSENTTVVK